MKIDEQLTRELESGCTGGDASPPVIRCLDNAFNPQINALKCLE